MQTIEKPQTFFILVQSKTHIRTRPPSGPRGIDGVDGLRFLVVGGRWVVAQISQIVGETAHLELGYNNSSSSVLVRPNLGICEFFLLLLVSH
jgi:hypothetical protein